MMGKSVTSLWDQHPEALKFMKQIWFDIFCQISENKNGGTFPIFSLTDH